MTTAVEVAAVKAQAQSIIRRVRTALDELSATVDTLPGEEVTVDDHAVGTDTSHGGTDPEGRPGPSGDVR
jgi:hypothetical protein